MSNEFEENDQEGQEIVEPSEVEKLNSASELAARKIQLAMMNAIFTQITQDPSKVSASLLAVAERMIARFNLGLMELPEDTEMTEEEKTMLKDFEEMSMKLDDKTNENTFTRMQ